MVCTPTKIFFISRTKKGLYKQMKIRREKIISRYPPFSPRMPIRSPFPELYNLYSNADKEVLYYHLLKLNRKSPFISSMVSFAIGIFTGIVVNVMSSQSTSLTIPEHLSSIKDLIPLLCAISLFLAITLYCAFLIWSYTPCLVPDSFTEKEVEIIYELLDIEKYFCVHPPNSSNMPK